MARTVKDVRLDNRAARDRLQPRKKPYFRVIEKGRHIGYYKGLRTGSWLARTYNGAKYAEKKLGIADDVRDANGADVLSFSEAQAKARRWFDEIARTERGTPVGPYTVEQACDAYLTDYKHRQGKCEKETASRLDQIKAALGRTEVRKLTAKQIKDWHRGLGEKGRLTRNQKLDDNGERVRRPVADDDAEAKRRRLSTANRTLTTLKAALNLAFKSLEELAVTIPFKTAWQSALPSRAVEAPKIRYLTDAEATRLLNSAEGAFRDLVAAALLTGARYGELCRLRVQDFDAASASIRVEISKSNKPRSIALTDEGVSVFSRLARGRGSDALLLVRNDGEPWLAAQQARRMEAACSAASIVPVISFHILRHTYGSRLAMRGAPMGVIAQQLGHADTRMTEKHYAHLAPSYVSDVVRSLLGTFGIPVVAENVVSISAGGRTA